MQYALVSAVMDVQLVDIVNKTIRQGLQPFGGPFVGNAPSGSVLVQAMVRYEGDTYDPTKS